MSDESEETTDVPQPDEPEPSEVLKELLAVDEVTVLGNLIIFSRGGTLINIEPANYKEPLRIGYGIGCDFREIVLWPS